jgi:MFS family permease
MMETSKAFSVFLLIWVGQFLSKIGSGVSAFALGVYLLQKTGSTSAYSFLLLAAFLPAVLLAPVGGVIADRNDRKIMMAVGDLGSSLGIFLVIVMLLLYPNEHCPIYVGVAISSLFAALQSPAFKASVTEILDKKAYTKASGLIQLTEAAQYLLAPFVAAFLLTKCSILMILAIDMLTFIAAALPVMLIRITVGRVGEKSTTESFRKDLVEGMRYLAGNKVVLQLLYLTVVVTFLAGVLQSLFVPIVLAMSNVATLGTVQSIAASGMLCSSLLIGISSKRYEQTRVLFFALFFASIFYILIGASTNIILITCTAFCFFFALPFVNASLEVLFRQNIENKMQGRIWSLISFISQLGMLVAFCIAGPLADHVFNPFLADTGRFAETLGTIFGVGVSRGSGVMVMVCGFLLLLYTMAKSCSVIKKGARGTLIWQE